MLARWQLPVVPSVKYSVLQDHLSLQEVSVWMGKYRGTSKSRNLRLRRLRLDLLRRRLENSAEHA